MGAWAGLSYKGTKELNDFVWYYQQKGLFYLGGMGQTQSLICAEKRRTRDFVYLQN